jgi:hypothetical protein
MIMTDSNGDKVQVVIGFDRPNDDGYVQTYMDKEDSEVFERSCEAAGIKPAAYLTKILESLGDPKNWKEEKLGILI